VIRRKEIDSKQVVDTLVASEDTIKFLLEGVRTYAPDYMHGLPKRDFIREAEEAIVMLRETAVVLARAHRAATAEAMGRKPIGRPPKTLEDTSVVETSESKALMRMDEIVSLLGFGKSTLYAMIKNHQFPAPIKIGKRKTAWRTEVVMDWLNSKEHRT
jgi:prophage regulatory protein